MTITLPLNPTEEARLMAAAQAKGVSADALLREALDKILTDAPPHAVPQTVQRPIWELIEDNMKDVPAVESEASGIGKKELKIKRFLD